MKYESVLLWGLFSSLTTCLPSTSLNIKILLDIENPAHDLVSTDYDHPSSDAAIDRTPKELPIIELPGERHQALPDAKKDQTYYKWANIPYAKPPVGQLRFKPAEAIPYSYEELPLNDGKIDVVCPQGTVGWLPFAKEFSNALFDAKEEPLDSKWNNKITPKDYAPMPKANPLQNESCLVLDVYVPKRLYDNEQGIAPVVVVFHGGGFVYGSKDVVSNPESFLQQSGQFGNESDVVIVSINYRLGAFGWLAGDDFVEAGGFENAGLTDQRVALEWIYENIRLFGGDSYAVTVLGESAGASSILHQITSYGGDARRGGKAPSFNKAILQSPSFLPNTDESAMGVVYKAFLSAAKAKTFQDLQNAKTEDLLYANSKTIYESPYGRFNYGPVVSKVQSNNLVSAPPSLLLSIGRFWHQTVSTVMLANNRREGTLFTPPWIRTNATLREYIKEVYPRMGSEELDETMSMYGITGDPKNERSKFLQAAAVFGDLGVNCNVWALRSIRERFYGSGSAYEYHYQMYPGFHGQDIGATFWDQAGEELTALNNEEQSQRLQRYLTSYIKHDDPNKDKLQSDKSFGSLASSDSDGKYMYLGDGLPKVRPLKDLKYGMEAKDPLPSVDKCRFWASAPYWGPGPENNAHQFLRNQANWQEEL